MFKKSVAQREKVKLMIGLSGPSGSGKTYSALQLAYGIAKNWKKVVLADTENKSALYYAGEKTGEWEHIDFSPNMPNGYHPNNWIKLIEFVESDPNIEVLILDSISHEWEAKGGALQLNQNLGGKFTDWAKVTPLHNAFIDKMRTSRLHIIATMRVKTDYIVEQNEKGKSAPRKVGLKAVQREGMDYEFGIAFDIESNHNASTSKDRTGLFSETTPFLICPEIGNRMIEWANSGKVHLPKEPELFFKNSDIKIEILHEKLAAGKVPQEIWLEGYDAMHGKEINKTNISAAYKDLWEVYEENKKNPAKIVTTQEVKSEDDEIPF